MLKCMGLILNIGDLGLINFSDKKILFLVVIFLLPCIAFSSDIVSKGISVPPQDKQLTIDKLTGHTIKEIIEREIFGKLVDIYLPCKILNCYVFVLKQKDTVYYIAANTEYPYEENTIENIKTDRFIAIGYYAIDFPDGTKKRMFKHSNNTPFDFLNEIKPEKYVSIAEIEKIGGIIFDRVDKGGFLSPFYDYYCTVDSNILYVMGSPSEDKRTSYFMGGWTYFSP